MRIVVNDVAAEYGGALSILYDFEKHVSSRDSLNEWIYILSGKYIKDKDNVKTLCFPSVKKSWLHRLLFDTFITRKTVNDLEPDIYVSLQNVLPRGIHAKTILYVHQPIPFQTSKKFSFFRKDEVKYAVYQHCVGALIKNSVRKADTVVVQTEWMKKAVEKIRGCGNVHKITPSVEVADIGRDEYIFSNVHFFYPTSDILYKNIRLIEDACKILDKINSLEFEVDITVERGSRTDVSPRINYIGRIDREEVFKRYNASVLLFPSYIETFGYPLAEARACGCYILASDCAFSHEVLAGYPSVIFFDPFSPDELAKAMEKAVVNSAEKRYSMNCIEKSSGWDEMYELILGDSD